MANFQGKTALVTGGCGGLGQAISKAFLEAGANVVACDINATLIKSFQDSYESNYSGKVLALGCDITKEDDLVKLFKHATDRFANIDFVVNNAGIMDRMDPGNMRNTFPTKLNLLIMNF